MLLSHLKFDTSPTEDSGVGEYAWNAYSDLPTITVKDGRSCAYFNGTTTSLVCADPVFPNIKAWEEDWSMSLLFNTSIVTGILNIIGKYVYGDPLSSHPYPFAMYIDSGKLVLRNSMTTNFNVGKWNSVAVLHKNHMIYLYLNRGLVGTTPDTVFGEDSLNRSLQFDIGACYGYSLNRFNGYMTDVRVYKGEAVLPSYRINTDSDKNYYGLS